MLEVAVRLAAAFAMLMEVIPTLPPLMLRFAVEVPPALVFTAMVMPPIVTVGTPTAALSPRFKVAVAPPVPVPVRLAMFRVVTSSVP